MGLGLLWVLGFFFGDLFSPFFFFFFFLHYLVYFLCTRVAPLCALICNITYKKKKGMKIPNTPQTFVRMVHQHKFFCC
jgi:hypothetical protein